MIGEGIGLREYSAAMTGLREILHRMRGFETKSRTKRVVKEVKINENTGLSRANS